MNRSLIVSVLNDRSRTTIGDPRDGDYAITIKLNRDDKEKLLLAFTQIGVRYATLPWMPGCVFIHDVLSLDRLCWFSYHLDTPVAEKLDRLVLALEEQLAHLELTEVAA